MDTSSNEFTADFAHVRPYDGTIVRRMMREILTDYSAGTYLEDSAATALLQVCAERTELALASICRRHSKFMLFLLTRKLVSPAMLVRDPTAPELDMAPIGAMTYAALKHGSSEYESCLQAEPIEPFLCTQDQGRDVRGIWELSAFCSYLAGLKLIVGDGGRIVANVDRLSPDNAGRPNNLDLLNRRRLVQNSRNFLSSTACFEIFRANGDVHNLDPTHPLVIFACPVVKPTTSPQLRVTSGIPDNAHYLLRHWDQHYVTQLLELNSEAILEKYRVSPVELAMVLVAIGARTIHDMLEVPGCMDTACSTGLSVFSYRNFAKSLVGGIRLASEVLRVSHTSKTLAARCMHNLLLDDRQYRELEVHYPRVQSIFYRFGNHVVVDWLLTAVFLQGLVTAVSEDAHMKNAKGAQFERKLGNYIAERNPHANVLFPPNKKLRLDGKLFAEVDLSYCRGNIAFIIDCKAYQVSPECARGDKSALHVRWSYTEQWLSHIISTTRALAKAPRGDNYEIPDDVEYLIPVVCSTSVERIYSNDDKYFLAPLIPRICTPFELEGLLSDVSLDLTANSYACFVGTQIRDS